ncbi:hypothetical protein BWI17_06170 [Betaproteobacteria bacterium GR16-43]|nr:hypothetical protein BWI17_06170 [Betaproteobacteria bacterium GR16-43]
MKKLLFLVVALAVSGSAGAAYRCVDEKGVTHIGDTPPAGCAKVPMFEISASGSVLRKIDPTPTAEELKAREAEAVERKERERAAGEQRRKDMALVNTYSNVNEFDMARDRNIEPVEGRIKSAKERIVAVDKRTQEISDEMEFYKAGKSKAAKKSEAREVPVQLTADFERVTAEKSALVKSLAAYEKEIQDIRTKFDTDKKRWQELKSNPSLMSAGAPAAAPTTVVPLNWTRGSAKCGEKTLACRKGETFLCLRTDGTWYSVTCEAPKL